MYADCIQSVYVQTRCSQDTFVFELRVQIQTYPDCMESVYIQDAVSICLRLDSQSPGMNEYMYKVQFVYSCILHRGVHIFTIQQ